jgi:hypothetical protein
MAHVDADVPDEVLRAFRHAMLGEITGRCDRHQAPVRADSHGDHVLLDALAQPDAGVEALLDDVAERAVEDQLDADIGIVLEHGLQLRPDHAFQRMVGERQPDRARRPVAERHQRRDLVLDLGHAWRDRLEQPLARRRRRDVPSRARQQPDAHTGFKLLDRVAEGRLHDADPCRRPGEAALLGNDPEPGQLVEIRLFHAALAAPPDCPH